MSRRASSLNEIGAGIERDVGSAYDTVRFVADNIDVVNNAATVISQAHTHSNKALLDSVTAAFTTALETKLNSIDANATDDQTGAEIKALYEAEPNAFTDALYTKLAGIETAAKDDQIASEVPFTPSGLIVATNVQAAVEELDAEKARLDGAVFVGDVTVPNLITSGNVDGRDVSVDGAKLDGIEANATADQTAGEIKTLYESNANTNAFTDTDVTTLSTAIQSSEKGAVNGVATLDASGLVPAGQLPSYVDDALEYATHASLPVTGESGKIYVVVADETDNGNTNTYRWTGSIYARITDTPDADEIKILYEANADTNAFTDQEQTRLADFVPHGVDSNADATLVTVNADPTKYDVAAFDYYINGTRYSFAGATGISTGFIAGDSFLIIGVNSSGLVAYPKNTFPSPSDLDTSLEIGGMATSDGSTISIIGQGHFTFPDVMKNISQWSKFVKQTNFIGTAGSISESSTARQVDVAGGQISDEHFHIQNIVGATDIGLVAYYRVAGVYELQPLVTPFIISNTQYDDGTNLATLGNNRWASHNIARSSRTGTYYFIYSDGEFNNEADAIDAPFSLGGFAGQVGSAVEPLAKIIIQKDATNVSQVIDVRNNVSQVISASTSTMQTTYDRSSIPHIVLSNGNIVEYRNDVGDLNALVQKWTNNAGTTSYLEVGQSGINVTGNIVVTGTVDGRDITVDGTKLDGIEANATQDQTGAEIKSLYELEVKAFTDTQFDKLAGIEDNATADQTDLEIKTAYENNANTNAYTDAEQTAVANIGTTSLNNAIAMAIALG